MNTDLVAAINQQINEHLAEIQLLNDSIVDSPAHRRAFKIQREQHYAKIGRLFVVLRELEMA